VPNTNKESLPMSVEFTAATNPGAPPPMVPTRPSQKKKYKSTENKYTASTTDVLIQHNTTVMSLLSLTAKEMSLLNNKASIQYTELTNSHIASVIETKLARGEVCIHGNSNSNSNNEIEEPDLDRHHTSTTFERWFPTILTLSSAQSYLAVTDVQSFVTIYGISASIPTTSIVTLDPFKDLKLDDEAFDSDPTVFITAIEFSPDDSHLIIAGSTSASSLVIVLFEINSQKTVHSTITVDPTTAIETETETTTTTTPPTRITKLSVNSTGTSTLVSFDTGKFGVYDLKSGIFQPAGAASCADSDFDSQHGYRLISTTALFGPENSVIVLAEYTNLEKEVSDAPSQRLFIKLTQTLSPPAPLPALFVNTKHEEVCE